MLDVVRQAPPPAAKTRRVVIVDVDGDERGRMRRLVERAAEETKQEISVVELSDGGEAAAALEAKDVALVVCEILLPGQSGLSLVRQVIEEHGREHAPPVVLVTSMARETDRYWGLRCGAHAYVTKPYEDDQLYDRIRHALLGGAPERPSV